MQESQSEPPTELVLDLQGKGASNEQIIKQLQDQGYSYELIADALHQADTKTNIDLGHAEMQPSVLHENNMGEAPAPSTRQQSSPQQEPSSSMPMITPPQVNAYNQFSRDSHEEIEEIAEAIIDEKWQKVFEDIGDLASWKERVQREISSIKQEVLRQEGRYDHLQQAVIGKIHDYDKNIADVGTEMKALEKLLQNIIKPLTQNVRELTKITEKLKK